MYCRRSRPVTFVRIHNIDISESPRVCTSRVRGLDDLKFDTSKFRQQVSAVYGLHTQHIIDPIDQTNSVDTNGRESRHGLAEKIAGAGRIYNLAKFSVHGCPQIAKETPM